MARVRKHRARWQVLYRDPDRQGRERVYGSYATKDRADKEKRKLEVSLDEGTYTDPDGRKVTLAEWSRIWLATKAGKEQATIDSYQGLLDKWVLPTFGPTPIGRIETGDIATWIAEMTKAGLGPSRVNQARLVLSGCLELAVEDGRLASNRAASKVVRLAQPKIPKKPLRVEEVPTIEQVETLIETIAPRWQGLIVVLAYAGVRFGEAAALRSGDVVIGGIYIDEAVKENSRGIYLGDVKDHEERFVQLPATVIRRIRTLANVTDDDPADRMLFTTDRGGLLSVSSFHNQVWEPALKKAAVRDRKLHVLRAFAASLWLDAGGSIEYVRTQLGHSDLATTQKYLVLFDRSRDQILDRLETMLADPGADQMQTKPLPEVVELPLRSLENRP